MKWLRTHSEPGRLDVEQAYGRGVYDDRRASLAFGGVNGLVSFPSEERQHEAVISYEGRLLDAMPRAYDQIRIARSDLGNSSSTSAPGDDERLTMAENARDELVNELERVRVWLDGFVRSAEEYAALRPRR